VIWLNSPRDTELIPPTLFKVTKLDIQPPEPYVGQRVRISVSVSNIGTETGSHVVELKINEELAKKVTVTLAGGQSTTIFIELVFEKPNIYRVKADWLEKTIIVRTVPKPHPVAPVLGVSSAVGISSFIAILAATMSS